MHDELTGLYDRPQFFRILHKQVRICNDSRTPAGLLVVEIQRFRKINSIYGYGAGDEVLQQLAELLKRIQREGDYLARIGSDSFALLLSRIANRGHAQLAAFKIQQLLDVPMLVGDEKIVCRAVVGLAVYPLHTTVAEEMLKFAEDGLNHAKLTGKSLGMLEHGEETAISETWDLEYELSGAIERSELLAFFQPKISLTNGSLRPAGAEALVRWKNMTRGMLPPKAFLPLAERIGIINPLTMWMLNTALRLSAQWGDKWGKLVVSVNIPPKIVAQPGFVDLVLSAKQLWQSDHVVLCLEVLEQSIADDVDLTFKKLSELREHGIKISIDDFGTGYSSLSYFRDIPADELKIDKSFISGLLKDKANLNIVSSIIDLAHRFGLSVAAEGVEDKTTLYALKRLGCDQMQGYYIGKPMPVAQFTAWLELFD